MPLRFQGTATRLHTHQTRDICAEQTNRTYSRPVTKASLRRAGCADCCVPGSLFPFPRGPEPPRGGTTKPEACAATGRGQQPWRCRWLRCAPGRTSSPVPIVSPGPTSRTSRNGTTEWSTTCSTTRPTI